MSEFQYRKQYQTIMSSVAREGGGAIRGLQIGAGFKDYKSGQKGLQIGVA